MVRPRGRPAPGEWADIRDDFETMYLKQNWTLNAIKDHFASLGFVATDRQYKTKVKAWELDRKKIKGPTWHSMNVVLKHRARMNQSTVFHVPIRGDHKEVVRSDRITKQINRDRSGLDWNNLERAEQTLREAGVEWGLDLDKGQHDQTAKPLQWGETTQNSFFTSASPCHDFGGHSEHTIRSGTDSASPSSAQSISTLNTHPTNFSHGPPNPIRFSLSSSSSTFPTPSRSYSDSTDLRSPYGTFPDLGPASYGSTAGLSIGVNSHATSSPSFLQSPIPRALDRSLSLHILLNDPSCTIPPTNGKHPEYASVNSIVGTTDDARILAAKWAAPYLEALLQCGKDQSARACDQGDRKLAREIFKTMLKTNNKYIFPYSNWLVTVLASNNQTTLLTEFLEDCTKVIDRDATSFKNFYGSSLHITLAIYTEDQQHIRDYYNEFALSVNNIRLIWGEESENYLVNKCYLSWLLLENEGNTEAAITILEESLPTTARIMGDRHVVTLNYMTVLARAYANSQYEHDEKAISLLQIVLDRLDGCAEPLQEYRFRQILRMGQLQMNNGNYNEAERNIRATVDFRVARFGLHADNTVQAVESLWSVLVAQGRHQEMAQLKAHMNELYEQELRERAR